MSRTDVAARAQAATVPAQPSVATAGAWLRTPSAPLGVFGVRPLPREATASYVQRLADTHQLTLPQLLDGAGITLHRHGTPPSAELILTPGAAQRLAVLARTPLPICSSPLPQRAM